MKKKFFILGFILLSLTACHNSIWSAIDDLNDRVKKLEVFCREMNSNIAALQTLVNAQQNGEKILSVTEVEGVGSVITFASGKSVTIYSGKDATMPQISVVKGDDDKYYWTLNGEMMLDEKGNSIPVSGTNGKDGITPQLKIENGDWYISYDNGNIWTYVGRAKGEQGDSFFTSVTQDNENVYFVLSTGETIIIQKNKQSGENAGSSDDENGLENGIFYISATQTVQASSGNLQYQASTGTYRFAPNQYDIIGEGNANIANKYDGWIDLFCWGTGNAPTKWTQSSNEYTIFYDWGIYLKENGWRTITKEEYQYLFENHRYSFAEVCGINGIIILPTNWRLPNGCIFDEDGSNSYNEITWANMEKAGAIFLPCGGYRQGRAVENIGTMAIYWSSSSGSVEGRGSAISFENNYSFSSYLGYYGCSVRLFKDLN